MDRYICIHGHFYQPPRENPWLETVEQQESAYPYHDWNERITAECYGPNSASRILDSAGRIIQVVNNYGRISFNFGPTLLTWMAERAPAVYRSILEADRDSQSRFSGHGSAIAQAYSHPILPLAQPRDKLTQVLWGIRDFEYRFSRAPEGLWLPETAVDLETLDIIARFGIKFTILAPSQASRVLLPGRREWNDVSGGSIDTSAAYTIHLPSGRSLSLFFFDGAIAHDTAFESALATGRTFAQRLMGAFSNDRQWPQLVHIATDGETYGHHRRRADMVLADALRYIETSDVARLTNYGEYLERHPPTREVEIFQRSSWSCVHGVERWRSDCGCNFCGPGGWRQDWRAPLREALDWLRDRLDQIFEAQGREVFTDSWRARDEYVHLILDRSSENVDAFLARHRRSILGEPDRVRALQLMELQRHAMLMYTSCGWFFDELSGIETVQVLRHAGRALELARLVSCEDFEAQFLERLERAQSNLPEYQNGRIVFDKSVRPVMADLKRVASHYAINSLFENYGKTERVYTYEVAHEDFRLLEEGPARLALGRISVSSRITFEHAKFVCGVLHLGDQDVSGGTSGFGGEESYQQLVSEIVGIFERRDIGELVRAIDRHFNSDNHPLRLLFRAEQRRIIQLIVDSALAGLTPFYRVAESRYLRLARFVTELAVPLPSRLQAAVESAINDDLLQALAADEPPVDQIRALFNQSRLAGARLDMVALGFNAARTFARSAAAFAERPADLAALGRFDRAAALCLSVPFDIDLWEGQNALFRVLQTHGHNMRSAAACGEESARIWLHRVSELSELLAVAMDAAIGDRAHGPVGKSAC